MSKAAERSSKVSSVTFPLSMLSTISLFILRIGVSLEWNRLYADCRSVGNGSRSHDLLGYLKIIMRTSLVVGSAEIEGVCLPHHHLPLSRQNTKIFAFLLFSTYYNPKL